MLFKFSTTQTPSIAIVQGAYEKFCVPATTATTYGCQAVHFGVILASEESVAVAATQGDRLRFQGLVAAWRQERGAMSSITEAALCPAYQRIIGMGSSAVPFILAQLKSEGDEPDQWFWALKAITGADPVIDDDRGDFPRMAQAWLQWANNEGHAG